MFQSLNLRNLVKSKLFITIFLFLLLLNFVRADFPITSCQSLNTPGTYVLLNDINSTSGVCFPIDADSITLDCNGHKIDGSNNLDELHAAIQVYHRTGVTLQDCIIERFGSPVWLDGTDSVSILDNVFKNNYRTISIRYSESNTRTIIRGNTFNDTSKIKPKTPTANYTEGWGVYLNGIDSVIEDNYVFNTSFTLYGYLPCFGSAGQGITVEGANNIIRNNRLEANGCGIGVFGTNISVEGNYIDGAGASNDGGHGLGSSANDSLFTQNTLENADFSSSGDGFTNVANYNNKIINNIFGGFSLSGENNLIAGNFFTGPTYIAAYNNIGNRNRIINNTFNSSYGSTELGGSHNYFANNYLRAILFHQGESAESQTTNNTFFGNQFMQGAAMAYTNSLNFTNNSVYYFSPQYSSGTGISLGYGSYATICDNTFYGTDPALSLSQFTNADICGNNFESGNIGIQMYGADYFRIFDNRIINNTRGIVLGGSRFGLAYNNFFNNSQNVAGPDFPSYSNDWNISVTPGINIIGGPYFGGNYWSDYQGFDANNDGFGDIYLPFKANGNISGDYLPLTVFPNPYVCGDLNDDNVLDVLDVVGIVNIAFRNGASPNPAWIADINGDGIISDVLDVVALVNHVFRGMSEPTCTAETNSIQASTTFTLAKTIDGFSVSSNLDRNVAGLQFDLSYDSAKVKILGVKTTTKTSGMTITNAQISDGKNRIGVYSGDGSKFISTGTGKLLTIQVSGNDLRSLEVSPIVVDYETGKKFSTVNIDNKLFSVKDTSTNYLN
ncbi:hypothetical protein HYT23_01560 [Candidatus Pacearchaeota archaeon]|nr:hypothetical protein [Candidatus Pacearchaeota archaeon]